MHGPAEVVDHHGCTTAGQVERIETAETSTCAGDDDNLPGEIDHPHKSIHAIDGYPHRTLRWNRYLVNDRTGSRMTTDPSASALEMAGLERLGLLASALSGCALEVGPVEPGQPAWTDGRTVFIDPAADARERLNALAVQSSLLAAGSLQPDVMRKLGRRPALAKRYLAVEGHRALAANEDLLPPPVQAARRLRCRCSKRFAGHIPCGCAQPGAYRRPAAEFRHHPRAKTVGGERTSGRCVVGVW